MKKRRLLASLVAIPVLSLALLTNSITVPAQSKVTYTILKPAVQTTTPQATSSQAKVVSTSISYEQRVIQLCNAQRARYGLSALSQDNILTQLCRMKSQDMAYRNYFGHTSPVYGSAFTMMKTYGVKFVAAGENIAEGQKTPDAVVTSWMNSAGHRANILNQLYVEIGVGLATDRYGRLVWTQMFIKP
ncbi:MAG: CAP domain-containing protein [Oscillospiraceae bacterium]|nr:CAP domain-containing protein [Oscillospiraceae bacterium]